MFKLQVIVNPGDGAEGHELFKKALLVIPLQRVKPRSFSAGQENKDIDKRASYSSLLGTAQVYFLQWLLSWLKSNLEFPIHSDTLPD